jgi:hypothetical protein
VSETHELADGDLVIEEPQAEEKQGGKAKWVAVGAGGIAVIAVAAALTMGVYKQNQVDAARKGETKAQAGVIGGGVYDDAGNMTMTASDSTCSMEYSALSGSYTTIAIDRGEFMTACLQSLPQTLKKDTTP